MTTSRAYIPIHAFSSIDITSLLNIALASTDDIASQRRYDHHHSRRTMLYYLLSMKETPNNEPLMKLITDARPDLDWPKVENTFQYLQTMIEPYQKQYRAENLGTYWELKLSRYQTGANQSLQHISRRRTNGFSPNELKLYWNYKEIHQLTQPDHFNPEKDQNSHDNLTKYPVKDRNNCGEIRFVKSGIQNAVFDVPSGKQVIVLDFADERMPGGYFLENARTQEEVILFNSDGYRALLDIKYQMMNGGYMLPEYGLAYVKNVHFYRSQNGQEEERSADLIVAACYDLSYANEGIHKPPSPSDIEDVRTRTYNKLKAIIASAVANTEGNGKNTYLLLGPIGTGAFANDISMIGELFSKILNEPLMDSSEPIRKAFDEIWFVSIDSLKRFEDVFKTIPSSL